MKEKEKYDVIKELVDHNGNKNRAAMKLNTITMAVAIILTIR